jgi:hypothetical protein
MSLDADGIRVATGNPRLYDADICALVTGLVAFDPAHRAEPDALMWQIMCADGGQEGRGGGGGGEHFTMGASNTGAVITADSDAYCDGGDGGDGGDGANSTESCDTTVMSDRCARIRTPYLSHSHIHSHTHSYSHTLTPR